MIIKERKFRECPECGSKKLIKDEEYGCDACKSPIILGKHDTYLSLTLFKRSDENKSYHFCSWECVFKKLKTLKTDDFISLPYLSFDERNKKRGCEGFWEAIKRVA